MSNYAQLTTAHLTEGDVIRMGHAVQGMWDATILEAKRVDSKNIDITLTWNDGRPVVIRYAVRQRHLVKGVN